MVTVQELEARRLLSYVGFRDANMLSIDGNPGADVIDVSLDSVAGQVVIRINAKAERRIALTGIKPGHRVGDLLVDGREGDDTIRVNVDGIRVAINGGAGRDVIESSAGRLAVSGGPGDDVIRATTVAAAADTDLWLAGDQGNDRIEATSARGRVNATGGAGRDVILTGPGDDRLWGGPGGDTLVAAGGQDVAFGGAGDDLIYGDDSLGAASGNDSLFGQAGDDSVFGGNGNDQLFGQQGADLLSGGAGADTLFGGGGRENTPDSLVTTAGDFFRGREYRRLQRLIDSLVPRGERPE